MSERGGSYPKYFAEAYISATACATWWASGTPSCFASVTNSPFGFCRLINWNSEFLTNDSVEQSKYNQVKQKGGHTMFVRVSHEGGIVNCASDLQGTCLVWHSDNNWWDALLKVEHHALAAW